MPGTFRPPNAPTRQERNREADERRGSARQRGYGRPWDKASAGRLRSHPFCEYCEAGAFGQEPCDTPADLTDHLYPHKGDTVVFWLKALWVSCCADCHNGPKQALEHRGEPALDALARRLGRPTLAEALQ